MLPIQRKGRARNFAVKPFPHDIGLINGYFTGYDVEGWFPIHSPNLIISLIYVEVTIEIEV